MTLTLLSLKDITTTFFIIIQISILYSLLSVSYLISYRVCGFLNLSHAITITLGGYFFYTFQYLLHVNIFISLLLALITTSLFYTITSKFIYLYIKNKASKNVNWNLFIITLGLYITLENLIHAIWGSDRKIIDVWSQKPLILFDTLVTNELQLTTISLGLLVLICLLFLLLKTRLGKEIQAVGSNLRLAELVGISYNRILTWTLILSSSIAAYVGIQFGAQEELSAGMGFNKFLFAISALIVGGVGSIKGAILGSIIIATLQHSTEVLGGTMWKDAVAFIFLVLCLLIKPQGIIGKRQMKVEV